MRGSTTTTMGQGAHHLGPSLAPAPHNSLLGRRIGASSLPAPPLVTTLLVQVDGAGDDDCAGDTLAQGVAHCPCRVAAWDATLSERVQCTSTGPGTNDARAVGPLPGTVDSRDCAQALLTTPSQRRQGKRGGRFPTAGEYDTSRLVARRLSRGGRSGLKGDGYAISGLKLSQANCGNGSLTARPAQAKNAIRKNRFRLAIRGAA